MEWVNVKDELPPSPTKVIVKTTTKYTEGNVLRITFHLDKDGKPVWGCHNQLVVYWLKEN